MDGGLPAESTDERGWNTGLMVTGVVVGMGMVEIYEDRGETCVARRCGAQTTALDILWRTEQTGES